MNAVIEAENIDTRSAIDDIVFTASAGITVSTTCHLYEYPVISPPELATRDGQQQYILVSMPITLLPKMK